MQHLVLMFCRSGFSLVVLFAVCLGFGLNVVSLPCRTGSSFVESISSGNMALVYHRVLLLRSTFRELKPCAPISHTTKLHLLLLTNNSKAQNPIARHSSTIFLKTLRVQP